MDWWTCKCTKVHKELEIQLYFVQCGVNWVLLHLCKGKKICLPDFIGLHHSLWFKIAATIIGIALPWSLKKLLQNIPNVAAGNLCPSKYAAYSFVSLWVSHCLALLSLVNWIFHHLLLVSFVHCVFSRWSCYFNLFPGGKCPSFQCLTVSFSHYCKNKLNFFLRPAVRNLNELFEVRAHFVIS